MDTLILGFGPGKECSLGRPAKYAPEFRDAAVETVRESGRPIAEVARELGVNEGTLGNWISRDRKARGEAREPETTESERAELARLRRENAQLRMEKEILKKRRPSS